MSKDNKHSLDDVARQNWERYRYGVDRGHTSYTEQAKRCEGMYLGGGEQWRAEDRRILDAEGRPCYEFNQIMPAVNTALGYQMANRMDITLRPRGRDGDAEVAKILSKVIKQVSDSNNLHWSESQTFGDGLIEQRGYLDVRMQFDNNIKGEVVVTTIDPRDAIPDPDAKSYDPDDWADFTWPRWLTLNEIGQIYGEAARKTCEASLDAGADFGDVDGETERNKFGGYRSLAQAFGAKVGAQGERARIKVARLQALASAKGAEWDGYRARISAESARIDGLRIQTQAMGDNYRAAATAVTEKSKLNAAMWSSNVRQYEAATQVMIQTAKMNNDAIMAANNARQDMAKVGAQVHAQLAASAYNVVSTSAQISGNVTQSISGSS